MAIHELNALLLGLVPFTFDCCSFCEKVVCTASWTFMSTASSIFFCKSFSSIFAGVGGLGGGGDGISDEDDEEEFDQLISGTPTSTKVLINITPLISSKLFLHMHL